MSMPDESALPETEAQYKIWAKSSLGADFDHADTENLYKLNVAAAVSAVQDHPFWRQLPSILEGLSDQYRVDHGADLFPGDPMPQLSKKPYASVVDKTFRQNVIWNNGWPKKPRKHDWLTDLTLYSIIDDLLRGKIVCTYLDGPGLVSTALKNTAEGMNQPALVRKLSRDEGYYAHHLYIGFPISVATRGGVHLLNMQVELQITTQPQELLRHLTHVYYKEQRLKRRGERDDWQWRFELTNSKRDI